MWGSISSCSKRSHHQHSPHAYISIVMGPTQQGTPRLPAPALVDDFLAEIFCLFVEAQITDLRDNLDDLHLLFDEGDPSIVVARAHSDPHIHSLHDQCSHVDVIVDPYVQYLKEVSISFKEIDGSLGQVLHTSLPNLHFFFFSTIGRGDYQH